MSRAALTAFSLCVALAARPHPVDAASPNPHVDPSVVLVRCEACHKGHGAPGSPMLPTAQAQVCLSCHGTPADLTRVQQQGVVAGDAKPPLLSSVMAQPYTHPINLAGFSQSDPGAPTCTSCHSPHRAMPHAGIAAIPGAKRLSPKDAGDFEYRLCESCHGNSGLTTQSRTDISRLLNPNNRSYHPVEGPATEHSPSVKAPLAGKEVSCSDCHGNDDARGPKGPHGSSVPGLLRANYYATDGGAESADGYALCYGCHDRQALLSRSAFQDHGMHIVDEKASCATCHNAHGSVNNRALIRFGEETTISGVSPSTKAGKLAFVSTGAGSGACYLTCHGHDHGPETYGSMKLLVEQHREPQSRALPPASGVPGKPTHGGSPRPAPRERAVPRGGSPTP